MAENNNPENKPEILNLSNLTKPEGQVKKQRRVGQGMGTGRSKYAGRGAKGAKSISGYSLMRGFEGGQMPLHRRLPKRGFNNPFREEWTIVNLGTLEALAGDTFDVARLRELGLAKRTGRGLKILAGGELKRKISVKCDAISEAARKAIEELGGAVELIPARQPYIRDDSRQAKRDKNKKVS
jgi:large subunit ribosomal protein L15